MGLGDIFRIKEFKNEIARLQQQNQSLTSDNQNLQKATSQMRKQLDELGAFDYYKVQKMTERLEKDYADKQSKLLADYTEKQKQAEENLKKQISDLERMASDRELKNQEVLERLNDLRLQESKVTKNLKTQTNKLNRSKELIKAINYTFEKYLNYDPAQSSMKLPENDLSALEEISPSVILKLHCMDVKDLRKAYRANDKQINSILEKYAARYTTKANQAIYKLMIIALRAELQNILYNLKYEKLDKSIEDVKAVTQKYLKVASDGNQSIAGTLTKFIGEIEYLFINSVKIYNTFYIPMWNNRYN